MLVRGTPAGAWLRSKTVHLSLSSLGSWLLLEAYRLLSLQSMLTQGFERLCLLYYMRMYINQNVSICSYFPFVISVIFIVHVVWQTLYQIMILREACIIVVAVRSNF